VSAYLHPVSLGKALQQFQRHHIERLAAPGCIDAMRGPVPAALVLLFAISALAQVCMHVVFDSNVSKTC
jgi:hypothetical protein